MTTGESTPTDAPADGIDSRREPARAPVRTRRGRRRRLVVLGALLVMVLAGVALALLARPLVSAKHEAQAAQKELTAAKAALAQDRFAVARAHVREARAHVTRARSDANGLGGDVWSVVPVAGTAVADERHLVSALDQTTSVAELGVEIYPLVSGGHSTLVQGQQIDVPTLEDVAHRTSAIGAHLEQALHDLGLVRGSTPLVGGSIDRARTTALGYLQPLQASYQTNEPLLRALPGLVGADGRRTYLLAMLNPSEQRYSGGATLSFTTLRLDHGAMRFGRTVNAEDLYAHGSYQSWQPVPGNVFHPSTAPMRVTNATFSPWWSVSGEELLRGYAKAFPGPHLDGLIGIDLQGLADVFAVTGPVNVPHVGQVDAGNLVHVLAGSYDRFPSTEARRQVNAALVPLFREKFLQGGQMSAKVKALVGSAKGRHFFLYFRNADEQRRFAAVGLSGDLSPAPNDYVGVFSQNLNGSKTDYWQQREVSSTVRLRADGSADVRLHVRVHNAAPAYDQSVPDPGIGYSTRYLTSLNGIFLPHDATYRSMRVNGRPHAAKVHRPTVADVYNRKFVQAELNLDYGQTGTIDVSYHVAQAAEVLDQGSLVYRLSADPQDLVTPEVLRVHVRWPTGFRPTSALPDGWRATATGATYAGSLPDQASWQIPLTKR